MSLPEKPARYARSVKCVGVFVVLQLRTRGQPVGRSIARTEAPKAAAHRCQGGLISTVGLFQYDPFGGFKTSGFGSQMDCKPPMLLVAPQVTRSTFSFTLDPMSCFVHVNRYGYTIPKRSVHDYFDQCLSDPAI